MERGGTEGREDEPTVLFVGEGERLAAAILARLHERGITAERAEPAQAAQIAFAAAPDLVVLAGTAAQDGGIDVLAALAARPATSSLPVVLIRDAPAASTASAFRYGLVAIIERSASADEMARRIAELARELPDRTGETTGELQRASVDDLLQLFAESLRSGILSVKKEGGPSTQVLLTAERPVEEAIGELVERLRPLIESPGHGALQYEFQESAPSRISSTDLSEEHDGSPSLLRGRRVLVIEQNPARSDLLGLELRSAGAIVVVADGSGHGLELARDLTPDVVLVDGSGVDGWALDALRQIRRDIWLRWASLLLVDSETLWRDRRRPEISLLAGSIDAQLHPDRELTARATQHAELDTRLEALGPVRTLRALVETRRGLRISVRHPRLRVEIDLADGLVAGATARAPHPGSPNAEGTAALIAMFGLSGGRVHVAHADTPRTANVMAPLDDAIAAAAREEPMIPPSLPPPSPSHSVAPSALPREDVTGLVQRLELLLTQLRDATDGDAAAAVTNAPEASSTPPSTPRGSVPRAVARPSELPPISETDEPDTGLYDPELVRQLRTRMRRSSQRIQAFTESSGPAAELPPPAPTRSAAPRAIPPPRPFPDAGVAAEPIAAGSTAARSTTARTTTAEPCPTPRAPIVPAPGTKAAGRTGASPARPKPTARSVTSASPSGPAPGSAGPAVEPKTPATGGRPSPPASPSSPSSPSSKASRSAGAAPGSAGSRTAPAAPRRAARRNPTLIMGSVPKTLREDAADPLATDAGPAASPEDDIPSVPPPEAEPTSPPIAPSPARPAPPSRASSARSPAVPREREREDARDPDTATDGPRPPEVAPVASPALAAIPPPAEPPRPSGITPVLSAATPGPASPASTPRAPARPRPSRALLGIALVGAPVIVTLIAMLGWWLVRDHDPEPSLAAREPVTEPSPPATEPAGPIVAPREEGPPSTARTRPAAPPPPATAIVGPGPGEPIEGREEDFDLARLGVIADERPEGRRDRRRRMDRLARTANGARNRGDLDAAASDYRALLALDGENGRAMAGMARIHMERNQPADAVRFAQRLVRLRPEYPANYVLLGDTLAMGRNPEAARRAFEAALERQPRWAPALERLQAMDAAD